MKKVIKWTSIGVGILVLLVIAALLIVPMFVDIQKYKPEIEKRVSDAVGRPFTIGGELKLSLFPWAGIAFTDLHLGNPAGFEEKDFVSVNSFDVKVKLIPLLSKDIQVERFVLTGPRIALIKSKAGRGNWEDIGKPSKKVPAKDREKKEEPIPEILRPFSGNADPDRCLLEQGYICVGSSTWGLCQGQCVNKGATCRGCFGPPPPIMQDHGAATISMLVDYPFRLIIGFRSRFTLDSCLQFSQLGFHAR